jgi:hypothetical protein
MQADPELLPPEFLDGFCCGQGCLHLSAVYAALLLLTSRRLARKHVKQIFDAVPRLFADNGSAARLAILFKRLLGFLEPRGREVRAIHEFCVQTAVAMGPPLAVMDLFTAVCSKNRDSSDFFRVMERCIATVAGYNAAVLAEATAIHAFSCVEDARDAIAVVPSCSVFFVLFNAVVASEKKHRRMGHEKLIEKYKGVHRRALEMLSDPKFRVFAPMFALFPEDVEVPAAVEEFLRETAGRVQRIDVVDQCHSW